MKTNDTPINISPFMDRKAREFFEKVGGTYPNYDFSEFTYTGCNAPSIVICSQHGPFTTIARNLLQRTKHPCPKCKLMHRRLSYNAYLKRAVKVHCGKYEYDKFTIENANWHDKIKIKCPTHSWFLQTKGSHLNGSGCKKCYQEQRAQMAKKGVQKYYNKTAQARGDDFIEKAIQKFGNYFDYSKVHYINTYTKVIIACPKHGAFKIRPLTHLQSYTGCPHCAEENLGFDYVKVYKTASSGEETGIFYKLLFTHKKTSIKFIKIGITRQTIWERFSKGYDDFEYEVLEQVHDTNLNCAIMEQKYKKNHWYDRFYIPKSWQFSGSTECYNYDKEQQLRQKAIQHIKDSLLQKQENSCAICKQPPKRPVLDHDHTKRIKGTSYCRGVLCSNCNVFLAKAENNATRYGIPQQELPAILKKMAAYIAADQTKLIHPSEAPKPKLLKKSSYNKLKKVYEGRAKFPPYPRSKRLTKDLERLFCKHELEPEFYK